MRKNNAVHKGNNLLPYPVIVSASQGDILAMNVVLSHYEPYIARLSMRTSIDEYGNPHTCVDEDMRSRLEANQQERRYTPFPASSLGLIYRSKFIEK